MDVITPGLIMADTIIEVDNLPIYAQSWNRAKNSRTNPGGASLLVSIGCARLGLKVTMLALHAIDELSNKLLAQLSTEGIVIQTMSILKRTPTVYSFVDSKGDFGRVVDLGTLSDKYIDHEWDDILKAHKILYIDGFSCLEFTSSFLYHIVGLANKHGLKIVFDPQPALLNIEINLLTYLLKISNVVSMNQAEFLELQSLLELKTGVQDLLTLGPQIAYIKDGENGCQVVKNSSIRHFDPISINVRNTQGAGDAFNAAVISGMIMDLGSDHTAIIANAAGAIMASRISTSLGFPTIREINAVLHENNLDVYALIES